MLGISMHVCTKYVSNMYALHIYSYLHMCNPVAPRGGTVISGVYKVEQLLISFPPSGEDYSTLYTLEYFYCHLTELGMQMCCKCNTPAYPFLSHHLTELTYVKN